MWNRFNGRANVDDTGKYRFLINDGIIKEVEAVVKADQWCFLSHEMIKMQQYWCQFECGYSLLVHEYAVLFHKLCLNRVCGPQHG